MPFLLRTVVRKLLNVGYKTIRVIPQSTFSAQEFQMFGFRNPPYREFLMLDCVEVLLKTMFSGSRKANTISPSLSYRKHQPLMFPPYAYN
ncbi:hypothetical protein RSJ42_17265 [Methanosarcina hadiensis]|uniref:hypothetical protein n=1 Tax=Methanosarcina hadiensis TaxID=3078083 RepID=UPI003977D76F